jgi:hypothetical protein
MNPSQELALMDAGTATPPRQLVLRLAPRTVVLRLNPRPPPQLRPYVLPPAEASGLELMQFFRAFHVPEVSECPPPQDNPRALRRWLLDFVELVDELGPDDKEALCLFIDLRFIQMHGGDSVYEWDTMTFLGVDRHERLLYKRVGHQE